jgi:hypothetical protein
VFPLPEERDVLKRRTDWGEARQSVRAIILTSSRARSDHTVDVLSDYDVVLALRDVDEFTSDDEWIFGYGTPMVRWGTSTNCTACVGTTIRPSWAKRSLRRQNSWSKFCPPEQTQLTLADRA